MTGPLEDIHGMIAGEGQMSSDLVKRLRTPVGFQDLPFIQEEAADRIEALEAQLAEARMQSLSDLGQAQDAYEAQLKAEAQLAEAHALFDKINRTDARGPRNLTEARWIARDGLTKTKKAALETKGTRGE